MGRLSLTLAGSQMQRIKCIAERGRGRFISVQAKALNQTNLVGGDTCLLIRSYYLCLLPSPLFTPLIPLPALSFLEGN